MGIGDLRILVVEDQSFQRWVVQSILETLGARRVLVAIDGRGAMDVMRMLESPPDIIITDLDMPGMDGMELMRHLGRERSTAALIITSALGRAVLQTVRTMGEAYGVDIIATLEKPTTLYSLGQAIDKHLALVSGRGKESAVTAVEMQVALREDELQPRFEPRLDVASRTIASAQASLVWADGARGILPATAFMDTVRGAGLSSAFALRLLRTSFLAAAGWRKNGLEMPIALPLPGECLRAAGFAERVEDCAATACFPAAATLLHFDAFPEGDGYGTMLENLSRLRMKGFGTSMTYGPRYRDARDFARMACNELAVDLAHVRDMCDGDVGRIVLAADLEAALEYGLSICAHGVRGREDWDLVQSLRVQAATGPCFGTPLPAAMFEGEAARRRVWRGFR